MTINQMYGVLCVLLGCLVVGGTGNNWGHWSPWSPCSRSCDSGLQTRDRICLNSSRGCEGPAVGWRLCSLHPCPGGINTDWRQAQCASHNSEAWRGSYHEWDSVVPGDGGIVAPPCTLVCRARDDHSLVVSLRDQVEDGTSCSMDRLLFGGNRQPRHGSGGLGVCIGGQCKEVGCDLEVGNPEPAVLDSCGVCGGNGSSCADRQPNSRYKWHQVPLSRCSASCGGGTRMVRHVCKREKDGETVWDGLCEEDLKPATQVDTCSTQPCPARWEVTEWSLCERECTGTRRRAVKCVSDKEANTIQVDESECPGEKPADEEPCTGPYCPAWYTQHHRRTEDGCNLTCGANGEKDGSNCKRICSNIQAQDLDNPLDNVDLDENKETSADDKGLQSVTEKSGPGHKPLVAEVKRKDDWRQPHESLPSAGEEKQLPDTHPSFLVGEWSACSASCGEGMRWRTVECKILLEFSGTVATLPDKECPGLKPAETEICVEVPSCSGEPQVGSASAILDRVYQQATTLPLEVPLTLPLVIEERENHVDSVQQEQPYQDPTYSWKITGYTTCTASCLGGLQESIVTCVDTKTEKGVVPYLCDPGNRLEIEVRACNEKPCPPRWNVSDFSSCSQTCGGGTQARMVDCIQEVAHGDRNVIHLPHSECPQPPPRSSQFCNVVDCPVEWDAGPWTKCSTNCGSGKRFRKVRCKQLLSLGQTIDRPDRECSGSRPIGEESCSSTECPVTQPPTIKPAVGQNYDQLDYRQGLVKLKVGGKATIFRGTSIKIRCPVDNYAKSEIVWAKGDQLFMNKNKKNRHSSKSKKVKVTRKGILRIKGLSEDEEGVYTCLASKSRANIEIVMKDLPSTPSPNDVLSHQVYSDPDHALQPWSDNGGEMSNSRKGGDGLVDKDNEDFNYWDSINNYLDGHHTLEKPGKYQDPSMMAENGDSRNTSSLFLLVLSLLLLKTYANQVSGPSTHLKSSIKKTRRKKSRRRRKLRHKNKRRKTLNQSDGNAANSSPLQWQTSAWSECTAACRGRQTRMVTCHMTFTERQDSSKVPDSFCDRSSRPPSKRLCGTECPRWVHSPWGSCHSAECIVKHTALKSRAVDCIVAGRIVDDSECDTANKPVASQPCFTRECVGVWVLGEWSPCGSTCGQSLRRRSVTCEWLRGGSAPTSECVGEEEQPDMVMQCEGAPCPATPHPTFIHKLLSDNSREAAAGSPAGDTDTALPVIRVPANSLRGGRESGSPACEDTNKFCSLGRNFPDLCATSAYRDSCCNTCRQWSGDAKQLN